MTRTLDPADMPPRVRALPRDSRGYPVPYIVLIDREGTPQFAANDSEKALRAAIQHRCGICGQPLGAYKNFVGGPGSAFHPAGRYFDGPVHRDCGEYALRVCPYLALAGRYARRIAEKKVTADKLPDGVKGLVDPTVHAPQPVVFVLAATKRFQLTEQLHYVPERPWASLSYWRGGVQITEAEAKALTRADPTAACPFDELVWS